MRKRLQHFHAGRLVYEWEQDLEEVHLYLFPPRWALPAHLEENRRLHGPAFATAAIAVGIESERVRVQAGSNPPFIDLPLARRCQASLSTWSIEDEELHLMLVKAFKGEAWPSVFAAHSSPFEVQEEMRAEMMRQRFQEENAGFDFSDAKFSGNVPDPRTFLGGIAHK